MLLETFAVGLDSALTRLAECDGSDDNSRVRVAVMRLTAFFLAFTGMIICL